VFKLYQIYITIQKFKIHQEIVFEKNSLNIFNKILLIISYSINSEIKKKLLWQNLQMGKFGQDAGVTAPPGIINDPQRVRTSV